MSKRFLIKNAARKMPPLYHKIPNQDFDIRKSRVIWWLIKQPDVLNGIWNEVKQSGNIKYDSATGKWQGVDFVAEEDEDI
nr:MAG TPA: hypothetical protein [Caudoviricetes sp.]